MSPEELSTRRMAIICYYDGRDSFSRWRWIRRLGVISDTKVDELRAPINCSDIILAASLDVAQEFNLRNRVFDSLLSEPTTGG